tara:strand:+ start:168 stop:1118 length:951 start_codon:yes stop_codon:yes gene_type:complete
LKKRYLFYPLIGFVFLYSIRGFISLDYNETINFIKESNFFIIWFSLLSYFTSHIIRTFRLYLLADDTSISFRKLLALQLKANSVNLALPFKLGEAYRAISFSKIFGSPIKSLTSLIIERLFDLFTIFVAFSLVILISTELSVKDVSFIYMPFCLVIFLLMTVIFVGESSLVLLQKRILNRYNGLNSIRLVKLSSIFLKNINYSRTLVSNKIIELTFLSILIWGFEILSLIIFYEVIGLDVIVFATLTIFISLSGILPNGPIGIGGLQVAFYYVSILFPQLIGFQYLSSIYSFIIFGSGLFIGLLLFISDFFKSKIK